MSRLLLQLELQLVLLLIVASQRPSFTSAAVPDDWNSFYFQPHPVNARVVCPDDGMSSCCIAGGFKFANITGTPIDYIPNCHMEYSEVCLDLLKCTSDLATKADCQIVCQAGWQFLPHPLPSTPQPITFELSSSQAPLADNGAVFDCRGLDGVCCLHSNDAWNTSLLQYDSQFQNCPIPGVTGTATSSVVWAFRGACAAGTCSVTCDSTCAQGPVALINEPPDSVGAPAPMITTSTTTTATSTSTSSSTSTSTSASTHWSFYMLSIANVALVLSLGAAFGGIA